MASDFPMDFSNFELEITNRCNLACPRCARTEFIDKFPNHWKDADLDLEQFKAFIAPVIDEIAIFEFKGTNGDPIFHPKFVEWISWCKQVGKRVYIHTNGQAGKSLWTRIADVLTLEDKIVVGIDGLPTNFMKYRINARWENIETLASILMGKVNLVWQYIVFSYNQDDVAEAQALSQSIGFNEFDVVNSHRWDENDWLKPSISYRERPTISDEVQPQCFERPMHIVTADGYYMPCCMLVDHRYRYKTPWARSFDISRITIIDVINSSISTDFFAKLRVGAASEYCRFNCGKCNGL